MTTPHLMNESYINDLDFCDMSPHLTPTHNSFSIVLRPVCYLLDFYIPAAEAEKWCNGLRWQSYNTAHLLNTHKMFHKTNDRFTLKPPMTPLPEHLGCGWAISQPPLFPWWFRHVATAYLSMERTISSMHPLILFCASKWVICCVDSPSIAKIMSPIHRLAWAALLPGVTYKIQQNYF